MPVLSRVRTGPPTPWAVPRNLGGALGRPGLGRALALNYLSRQRWQGRRSRSGPSRTQRELRKGSAIPARSELHQCLSARQSTPAISRWPSETTRAAVEGHRARERSLHRGSRNPSRGHVLSFRLRVAGARADVTTFNKSLHICVTPARRNVIRPVRTTGVHASKRPACPSRQLPGKGTLQRGSKVCRAVPRKLSRPAASGWGAVIVLSNKREYPHRPMQVTKGEGKGVPIRPRYTGPTWGAVDSLCKFERLEPNLPGIVIIRRAH